MMQFPGPKDISPPLHMLNQIIRQLVLIELTLDKVGSGIAEDIGNFDLLY